MSNSDARVPLEASRSYDAAGSRTLADPDPSMRLEASILVRRRPEAGTGIGQIDQILSGQAPALSREQVEESLGADPADLQLVSEFAESQGLTVLQSNPARRTVRVAGTVSRMEKAFETKLRCCRVGDRLYLCYEGVLSIPAALKTIIVAVLGLDQRPVARR